MSLLCNPKRKNREIISICLDIKRTFYYYGIADEKPPFPAAANTIALSIPNA